MRKLIDKITRITLVNYFFNLFYGKYSITDPDTAFNFISEAEAEAADIVFAVRDKEEDKETADRMWRNYLERGSSTQFRTLQRRIKEGRRE